MSEPKLERCPMRSQENGNCSPLGGFCQPNTAICLATRRAYEYGFTSGAKEAMRRAPLPDNKALTVEELRGMDGEPVWVENRAHAEDNGYYLVNLEYEQYFGRPDCVSEVLMSKNGCFFMMNNVGRGLTAYRCPPEKGK